MIRNDTMMMWPVLGLFLNLPACGDDGGGGGGGGGTDGGEGTAGEGGSGADDESGEPPAEPPNPNGGQCGGEVLGWETECLVQDVVAEADDRPEIPGLPPEGGSTLQALCCEGHPSVATADAGCHGYCMVEICEAALVDHFNRCEACLVPNCGFDVTDCLDGGAHTQIVACLNPGMWDSYTLTTSCSAINNQSRNPDGSFSFLEQPLNDTMTDPDICDGTANLELDPPRGLGQYKASASDGTLARLTWSMGEMTGEERSEERSEELDVRFEYGIMPCSTPSNDCMELTALELSLPPTDALGMTITKARRLTRSASKRSPARPRQ
jgi:hypothetical protein